MPDEPEVARAARADDDPPRPAAGPLRRRGSRAARRSGPVAVGRRARSRRVARLLDRALALGGRGAVRPPGRDRVAADRASEIDWPQVAEMYRRLAELTGSPVVELNRAVALAQAGDARAALARSTGSTWTATSISTRPAANCCGVSAATTRPGRRTAGRWSSPAQSQSGAFWRGGSASSDPAGCRRFRDGWAIRPVRFGSAPARPMRAVMDTSILSCGLC